MGLLGQRVWTSFEVLPVHSQNVLQRGFKQFSCTLFQEPMWDSFFFFYCLLTNIGYYNEKDSELICNVYVIFYGSLICISLIAMRLNHLKIGIPFSANWVSSFEEHSFPQCTAHGQTYTQDLEINTLLVVFQAIVYSSSSLLILIVLLSGLLCVLHRCSLHL